MNRQNRTSFTLFHRSVLTQNCLFFFIAAERYSERCKRGYGGKRTGQGYMNITCDYRLENSVLVHENGFVFSYYSFSVYRFKSIPSKSSLSFLVTPVPQILNINQNSKIYLLTCLLAHVTWTVLQLP